MCRCSQQPTAAAAKYPTTQAVQVSFANAAHPDIQSTVDHTSSLRRRWRRRDVRSTASDSEEELQGPTQGPTQGSTDKTVSGGPEEAREGDAGDSAARNSLVEHVFRPVYRGVLRPIGKRVQLLVMSQEEPKPMPRKRFLSRHFLSAYGYV